MSEGAGENEFTELVADHIFCDIDRDKSFSVVNGDCVIDEFREDGGTSGPGLDDFLLAGCILILNSLQEFGIAIRSLL
jgi:hypothetical protein